MNPTDDPYKQKLNPKQYQVMRKGEAEKPYSGKYWNHEEAGTYRCAACETPLFSSKDKFDAKTGWPSFKNAVDPERFEYKKRADSPDMDVRCKKCQSTIGRLIMDGQYFRAYSAALVFEPNKKIILEEPNETQNPPAPSIIAERRPDESSAAIAHETGSMPLLIIATFVLGATIGLSIGATAAYLSYHKSYAAIPPLMPTPIASTSTATTSIASSSPAGTATTSPRRREAQPATPTHTAAPVISPPTSTPRATSTAGSTSAPSTTGSTSIENTLR